MIFSIRKLAYEQDLTNTGYLWFKNMNEADPYYILPAISFALTFYNLGRGINKYNEHWVINRWRSLFQVFQICYLPLTVSWPVGSHVYWITTNICTMLQQIITKHPAVMAKINPTFFIDMQKVFYTERSKADSERYIEKLKNCEDTIMKSPVTDKKVLEELEYESIRMGFYFKSLKYKRRMTTLRDRLKEFYRSKKEKKK